MDVRELQEHYGGNWVRRKIPDHDQPKLLANLVITSFQIGADLNGVAI